MPSLSGSDSPSPPPPDTDMDLSETDSDLEQRWTDKRHEIRAFKELQTPEAIDGGTEGLQALDVTLSAPYW